MRRGVYTLFNQEVLPDELIIVDDGSTDNTRECVWELKKTAPFPIKYIYLDHPEPRISCKPRNVGIKQAKFEIVAFTEPECLHIGNTVKQIKEKLEEFPTHVPMATQIWTMGQKITETLPEVCFQNPTSILAHEYADLTSADHPNNIKAPDADWGITGSNQVFAGCLFAVPKRDLEYVGGFDEEFTGYGWDDWDLLHRLDKVGKRWLICNDIIVIHQWHPKNYGFDIYKASEENGNRSKKNIDDYRFCANLGKDWGVLE